MIKSYSEFINEEFSAADKGLLKALMADTMHNIDAHGFVPEYCEIRQDKSETGIDTKRLDIRISAKKDVILNECEKDVTVMVLPSNYKPNALVSLSPGSWSKDTPLNRFEAVQDEGVCRMFRELYDDVCAEYGQLNMIIITLMY